MTPHILEGTLLEEDPLVSQTMVRAAVQQRCAEAFLHDIRGSLQAVFGALELLCRVAKGGADESGRADKACDLARRTISHHEKTLLELFQLLTFQPGEEQVLDLRALADELLRLFRNDLATNGLAARIAGIAQPWVKADRAALHAAVAALLSSVIDSSSSGAHLLVQIDEEQGWALLTLQTLPGGFAHHPRQSTPAASSHPMLSEERMIQAVSRFACDQGGRLEVEPGENPQGRTLRLRLPCTSAGRA